METILQWAALATIAAALVTIAVAIAGGLKGVRKMAQWVRDRESFEKNATEFMDEVRAFFAGQKPPDTV